MTDFIFNTPLGATLIIVLLVMAAIAAWGAIGSSPRQVTPMSETSVEKPVVRETETSALETTGPCAEERQKIADLEAKIARLEGSGKRFEDAPQRTKGGEAFAAKEPSTDQLDFRSLSLIAKWRRFEDYCRQTLNDRYLANQLYHEAIKPLPNKEVVANQLEQYTNWLNKKTGRMASNNDIWHELQTTTRRIFRDSSLLAKLRQFENEEPELSQAIWEEARHADPLLNRVKVHVEAFQKFALDRGANGRSVDDIWNEIINLPQVIADRPVTKEPAVETDPTTPATSTTTPPKKPRAKKSAKAPTEATAP